MAKVRPGEAAGTRLARARMLGALFGEHSAAGSFRRFRVLHRLGAGSMGVVYEAYDPDLARGVALKLVNVATKERETALAEAKALARLSHPHVVPIYDVGLDGDHVYMVMELVRGKTLRTWSEGRGVREIVAVYHQAGLALAAAHAAGLIHRDFKPDNAIVGADGRVRVVDFGLACQVDDPACATNDRRGVAGTPRFMAPEIKAGGVITPAADQYSFSVALSDELTRARDATPRWIATIVERGCAADRTARFASMTDLLRALTRDPAARRRRVIVAGAVVAGIATTAFFAGRTGHNGVDICEQGSARLGEAWSPDARITALDRVTGLGRDGAALRGLLARTLDAHSERWVREYRAACIDRRGGAETAVLSDRRTVCLKRGTDALAAVGALIAGAEPANLVELPRAVQSIPDPSACSDLDSLVSDIAPPPPQRTAEVAELRRRITEAGILVGAGRYDQAVAATTSTVANARSVGYPPVLAEALLVQGHARMNLADKSLAIPVLTEAVKIAMAARDDALVVEAWARRAYAQAKSEDTEGALAGSEFIELLAGRTASATFARALLYNNLGSVELARDHRAQARDYFDRALSESRKASGPGALELVVIRANLALVIDDRARADRLLVEAADELATRLGDDHPDTLQMRQQRGMVTIEDLRRADEVLTPICRANERHAIADRTAYCWTQVGLARWDLGAHAPAIQAMESARAARPGLSEATRYLTLWQGDARAAASQFADAIAALPARPDEPWWRRLERGYARLGLGRARRELGDLPGARAALEAAIADLEVIVRDRPVASFERRLGRARVELALTLVSSGALSPRGTEVVSSALAWLQRVGGTSMEIAQITAGLPTRSLPMRRAGTPVSRRAGGACRTCCTRDRRNGLRIASRTPY